MSRSYSHAELIMMSTRKRLLNQGYDEKNLATKAIEYFGSFHFARLPFVAINAHMWAAVAYRAAHGGQRKLPSRGFANDVKFLSTLLPFCDAMFIDKEAHEILVSPQLRELTVRYSTQLFSLPNQAI